MSFDREARLDSHLTKSLPTKCDIYDRTFCSENRLHRHKRTEHARGGGTGIDIGSNYNINLNVPIYPDTGHCSTVEYKHIIDENFESIQTHTTIKSNSKRFNRRLSPKFTYNDLKAMLQDIFSKQNSAFKVKIGFSTILYDTVNQVYQYFYVSTNHLSFGRTFTVATNQDFTTFLTKLSLDIRNSCYLKHPNSRWIVASLPNIEVFVYLLRGYL